MPKAADYLELIRQLPAPATAVRVLNVCGGHERSIAEIGLRSLLPDWVKLLPGPGCPVCVCPEEAIYQAIHIALAHPVTLVAFGDMLRVPVNVGRNEPNSLAAARAQGADIRPIASPLEVIELARQLAPRPVVFFAAGFETTMAPVAAMLADPRLPENLFMLLAGRLTWPAVAYLLSAGDAGFEAMIAPGHVAAIMGANEWRFVAERFGLPVAVAGFSADSLLCALYTVLTRKLAHVAALDNAYAAVVKPEGNLQAQKLIAAAFSVEDAAWRGIGMIPDSGYRLAPHHARRDAATRFPIQHADRKRAGAMPPGCDCAAVLLARKSPDQCRLYGSACTPSQPVGPCMVSDEGACHIWWAAGLRRQA
ncbi:MAG: hypD [Proteobacteria bacterium]|nr:hypD [Pseudomonadota bacterium]